MDDNQPAEPIPDLGVEVTEEVGVGESLAKWKPWFNGLKHFFLIKVLPPRI